LEGVDCISCDGRCDCGAVCERTKVPCKLIQTIAAPTIKAWTRANKCDLDKKAAYSTKGQSKTASCLSRY